MSQILIILELLISVFLQYKKIYVKIILYIIYFNIYLFIMKKIRFLFILIILTLSVNIAFWVSLDQVTQVNTSTKFLWLISADTIINIITKLFLVIITIIWIFIFKKILSDKLVIYLENKFENQWWWWDEIIWMITRTFNITTLVIGVSLILGIIWVDLWIFMWWIWFGIGFTLKTFLTNFTAWIIMVSQWVYHNWDLIKVSEEMWKIVKINALFTVVEKLDWVIFYIPNINFLEHKVLNYNSNNKRRVDIETLVEYDTDIIKAKSILNKVLDNFPNILNDPKPQIVIDKLGDSWILIIIRAWIWSRDSYIQTKSNITETINLAFKQSKIKISYPHLQIINK